MQKGDYIVCKKNFYTSGVWPMSMNVKKLFQKSLFKKNQKYKIENIITHHLTNSGGTYLSMVSTSMNVYYINGYPVSQPVMDLYFYTKKEERNIKLKKIKNGIQ